MHAFKDGRHGVEVKVTVKVSGSGNPGLTCLRNDRESMGFSFYELFPALLHCTAWHSIALFQRGAMAIADRGNS